MRTLDGGFGQQEVVLFDPPKHYFWGDASPGDLDPETASIVVGTKYRISSNNLDPVVYVWGVRWFRTDEFTGVSEVAIFDGATNLISSTVTGETADGWQQQLFEFGTIIEGEDFIFTVAALYTGGSYRSTPGLFATSIFSEVLPIGETYTYQIEAVANSISANGVYDFSSTMVCPTTSAAETCFYIDMIYSV